MKNSGIQQATDFTWAELGDRIRDLRIGRSMTQQDLAVVTGLSQAGLYRIEAGETNPQLESLQRIAAAFQTTVRAIVCGTGTREEVLPGLVRRVNRIAASGDELAIRTLLNGVEAAEALVRERSRLPRREVRMDSNPLQAQPGQPVERMFAGEARLRRDPDYYNSLPRVTRIKEDHSTNQKKQSRQQQRASAKSAGSQPLDS